MSRSIFGESKNSILSAFCTFDKVLNTKHIVKFIDKYVVAYETNKKIFNYYLRTSDPLRVGTTREVIKNDLELQKTKLAKLL